MPTLNGTAHCPENMNEQEIMDAIGAIAPWDTENYREWDLLIRTAKELQRCDPIVVQKAIKEFIAKSMWCDDSDQQWSKIFLLLRVMFDLPEAVSPQKACFFGGWMIPWRASEVEGNANLAWPMRWRSGKPELVACFTGYKGPPYQAEEEYRYYLESYPFRVLC